MSIEGLTGTLATSGALSGTLAPALEPALELLSLTGAQTVEVGADVVTPAFAATYSRAPQTAVLTDDDGSAAKDVSATPEDFTSDGTFSKTANNGAVVFTLTAEAESDTVQIDWQPRIFWGLGGASLLTEAQIEALANSELAPDREVTIGGTLTAGEYLWVCFPQSYDAGDVAVFTSFGFEGGFQKIGVVSVTNADGVAQDYACWRTDFPKLGTITVEVT